MIVASPDVYIFPPGLARVREQLDAGAPPDRLAAAFIDYARQVSACVHQTLDDASRKPRANRADDGTQDQLRALVKQATTVGREVLARVDGTPSAARMTRALEVLDIEQKNIVTGWPTWVSPEEILADVRAGKGVPVEVAFAGIAGMSVEEWERYVSEVKARRGAAG